MVLQRLSDSFLHPRAARRGCQDQAAQRGRGGVGEAIADSGVESRSSLDRDGSHDDRLAAAK